MRPGKRGARERAARRRVKRAWAAWLALLELKAAPGLWAVIRTAVAGLNPFKAWANARDGRPSVKSTARRPSTKTSGW